MVIGFAAAACTNSNDADLVAGFQLCSAETDGGSKVSAQRRQEIMDQAIDAGIAWGGGGGLPSEVGLFVLDKPSLEILAAIAEPDEVCVSGQDPADYVEPGPQLEAGPGWRWLGSAKAAWIPGLDPDLITDADELQTLWATMFPETTEPPPDVDFETESVLVLRTLNGITPGPCGFRFEGITQTETGLVVAEMFSPGGSSECLTIQVNGTYAVAIEHATVGEPPFDFAIQFGPREDPEVQGSLG